MVWNRVSFANNETLGDVLADYVDQGGTVSLAWAASLAGVKIGGRLRAYAPLAAKNDAITSDVQLGAVVTAQHALLLGVQSLICRKRSADRFCARCLI